MKGQTKMRERKEYRVEQALEPADYIVLMKNENEMEKLLVSTSSLYYSELRNEFNKQT